VTGSENDGECHYRDKTQTYNSHKVVVFSPNKWVFINPRLNVEMVGPKTDTDLDIDNRHGPKRGDNRHGPKKGELLCPMERGTAAPHFLAHVYCGRMVAHLSYWRGLVDICFL